MAIDNAFINPELDLQMHQSNIDNDAGYEAVLLKRSILNADATVDELKSDTESVTALEAMAGFIRDKKVDKTSAILFNIAVEGYGNLNKIKESKPTFALESLGASEQYLSDKDKEVALENIAHNTLYAMDKLSQSVRNTILSIGDLVHSFDKNLSSVKKKISILEELIKDIDHKEELAYNYIKPEKQFIYLMYTEEGFGRGIKPVLEDVSDLFKKHTEMVESTIKKYKNWYINNRNNMNDVSVFDELKYNPKDFILSGSTVFNKSVGTKTPSRDCVFYRTAELPGGLCLYMEVQNDTQRGVSAIDALMDVDYFLHQYSPDSFRVTENRLYTVAALSVLAWASVMVANPLPMALTGVVTNFIDDKTKYSDVRKVRIDKDIIFPTMSKDEIKNVISKLKQIVNELDEWNEAVYAHNWKDKTVKDMMNDLSEEIKTNGYNNSNVKHFRNYAIAMVSLMSKSYTKLHSYGFDVINAVLSYTEKSARQYR